MGMIDYAVIAVLSLAAAWPVLAPLASRLKPRPAPAAAKPAAGSPIEAWRQAWAATLITLLNEIEAGEGHFEDEKAAIRLAKELLWEIIGGDGPTPSKSK